VGDKRGRDLVLKTLSPSLARAVLVQKLGDNVVDLDFKTFVSICESAVLYQCAIKASCTLRNN
jgi:hypothetical protein